MQFFSFVLKEWTVTYFSRNIEKRMGIQVINMYNARTSKINNNFPLILRSEFNMIFI